MMWVGNLDMSERFNASLLGLRTTLTAWLMVAVFLGTAVAGPFEDAAAAYERGDYATALRLFRTLADQGDADAQNGLGLMYREGRGVPQNYAEALKWFRKSADQGNANAQFKLGAMYQFGLGVPRNYPEAVGWFRKAGDRGDAASQWMLARIYANGAEGVPQNYAEALKWLRLAADQGGTVAQSDLGNMYYNGKGIPKNYAEALKWYRLAADQGYATAQLNLGTMYAKGEGVPQNYAEALKWLRLAADQGDADAQRNIGIMYYIGRGVPQDYVRAYMWLSLSAAQGAQNAEKSRGIVAEKMTAAQIAEAQELSRDWKPQVARRDDASAPPTPAPRRNPSSQSGVALKTDGGIFVLPVEINGVVTLDFAIDSGASDVTVPADVFSTLKRAGTIKDSDVIGQRTYLLADGSKTQSSTFTIRSLKVGNMVIENVRASVASSQGSLLLGQSFLKRFKSWSIDNAKHELLLEPR
jgi:clan AA aspartic protease (TIGR02281 family)